MKKTAFILLSIALLFGTLLAGCADYEEDSEPGMIETFTEETADEITTSIKRPLNKARSVKKTGQDRMKGMDGMVKE
jgi:hypothetical protein